MENYAAYGTHPHEVQYQNIPIAVNTQVQRPYRNRYIYVNQASEIAPSGNVSQKVLINPHFQSSKVFVNPNFSGPANNKFLGPSIHVNPRPPAGVRIQKESKSRLVTAKSSDLATDCSRPNTQVHINPKAKSQSIYINPRFSKVEANSEPSLVASKAKGSDVLAVPTHKTVFLSKTKLIRTAHIESNKIVRRRNSVTSQYKIVKSHLSPKIPFGNTRNVSFKTKYKLDNKSRKFLSMATPQGNMKFVKKRNATRGMKDRSLVNISGILFKKSRNSIRRASLSGVKDITPRKIIVNTTYKLIKKVRAKNIAKTTEGRHSVVKKYKVIRKHSPRKGSVVKIAAKKLRKCNIPCPSYRKYGVCKGKENGKCSLKHNSDQIALCTRFLQGACIKEKCLLSHNVSPEKMPTCKYYLEGTCSKESCPYLHVKISSKAEVCRDFLEGFCRKADQCDKRHQYLCPEYEKHGTCLKQRCAYPHGKMVRTYVINKNKFVKKCSEVQSQNSKSLTINKPDLKVKNNTEQVKEKARYYAKKRSVEDNSKEDNNTGESNHDDVALKNFVGLQRRPKLGSLPSFIAFGES